MNADQLCTLPQLAKLLGVEYRTLHTWARQGLLTTSVQESRGTGVPNLLTRQDAARAKVIADLRHAGVGFDQLHAASAALRAEPELPSSPWVLVLTGTTAQIVTYTEALDVVQANTLTLIYNLAATEAIAQVAKAGLP